MTRPPPHPSHEWPEVIEIGTRCTRCGVVRGGAMAELRCVPVVFDDDPRAGMPCDVEGDTSVGT